MAKPPAIDFEFFSPASLRTLDHAEQVRAVRREVDRRRRANAARIEKGDLRTDHAATDEARWDEILADMTEGQGGIRPARRYQFTWADKLNALRGEIMRRRRSFPKLLEQGRINAADADEGIAMMECAHRWYWVEGMAFGAEFIDPGDAAATMNRLREEEARRHAWEHSAGVDVPELLAVMVDGVPVAHLAPGPFTAQFDRDPADRGRWLPSNVLNAAGDPMFGHDRRIVPMIEAMEPEQRARTILAIAAAFNRQWHERTHPIEIDDEAQQEAA
ncbi:MULTISPECIES: hypothetical protein [unclassified Sphingomonas]|uniref:hypothetical protein n=1 Tax=unclassified Sphingomonas TaxID=196159 RepID=UPI0006FF1180|nr:MULTISPECIES: hypothetical protein [unclassified Sphingomonas]KQX19368.1 hypothetical protein ASD17_12565 [Sphingomonas sp. Root1294]KQY65571.1 hypothetical protein ASD39_15765 [Sphingomonas sp. Root50]KRB95128.1 hypothetical protein ASE22_04290 [Sphingomonas sp. Root720]